MDYAFSLKELIQIVSKDGLMSVISSNDNKKIAIIINVVVDDDDDDDVVFCKQ